MPITDFPCRVIENKQFAGDIFRLSFSKPKGFDFKPGQFLTVLVSKGSETKWTPYSIISQPSESSLSICFRMIKEGFSTPILSKAEPGSIFSIRGPFGAFTFDKGLAKRHCFIAAGTGIMPLYSMLKAHLPHLSDHRFKLVFGAKTVKELMFHDEFLSWQEEFPNFEYVPVASREDWQGAKGHVQDHIGKDLAGTAFYICGLKEMVEDVCSYLEKGNVSKDLIRFERYS